MELFFIAGLPKTGSSWLSGMLNDAPGILCLGEGRFFSSGLHVAPSLYGAISDSISRWSDYIAERKGNWLDNAVDIKTIEKRNYVSVRQKASLNDDLTRTVVHTLVKKLMTERADAQTAAVGDKTPTFSLEELDNLQQTFPEGKVIFLHRGVYDFIVSYSMHYYRSTKNGRPDASMEDFSTDDFLQIDDFLNKGAQDILPVNRVKYLARKWQQFDNRYMSLIQAPKYDAKIFPILYEELRKDTHLALSGLIEFLTKQNCDCDIEKIVSAWDFDAHNMTSDVRNQHVNSKVIGYGKEVLNNDLKEVIMAEIEGE